MKIICTRPNCTQPHNFFSADPKSELLITEQKYCQSCGMELLLEDRYLPIEMTWKSSFGTVYLARDSDRRAVTNKSDRGLERLPLCLLKQFKLSDDFDLKRAELAEKFFQREGQALKELSKKHPQIPDIHSFFSLVVSDARSLKKKQHFFIAQEFIAGQNLQQELKAKGSFSEAETISVLTTMLEILEVVHDSNMLHRNIKTSNIMRDERGVLYPIDFSLMKELTDPMLGRTPYDVIILNTVFAPPEQMSGRPRFATDIYSLGVTCIHLLTGKPPRELYGSGKDVNVWQWHQFAPHVSDRLKRIIDGMVLYNPSKRFQSARIVLDELTKQSSQNAAINKTPAKSNQTRQRQRRKKRPVSQTEILTSAAFVGFEGSLIYLGLSNWLSLSRQNLVAVGAVIGWIIFMLYCRAFRQIDLLTIAAISAGVVAFVPKLQGDSHALTILAIAFSAAAVGISITICCCWGYKLLSRLLLN